MGAVTALAAPSSATTGTVALDKSWYTTGALGSGSAVKVTVTDKDANVTSASSTTASITLADALSTTGVTVTMPTGDEIVGTPYLLDNTKTTCATTTDTDEDLVVTVSSASAASLIIQSFSGSIDTAETRTICFDQGKKNTLSVKIWSTQTGETGAVTLTATETGVSTDKFEATVTLLNSATATAGYLHALNLNSLTAQYTDTTPSSGTSVKVTATGNVETSLPISSNLAPVTKFATQSNQPAFTGTISDSGAGLDVSTILIGVDTDNSGTIDSDEKVAPTVTGADGDLQVTWKYTSSALPEADIDWQVEATDLAGNVGLSDSDADTAGSQTNIVRVDKTPPTITSAKTGNYWDSTTNTTKANKNTSLEILFGEDIDAATVAPEDFTVGGVAPTAADVYTKKPASVFLTVGTATLADATPTIAIATAGAVSDKAGNALNVGSVKAADVIAPTFTVSVDVALTKKNAVVSISADEKISGVPTVEIYKAGTSTAEKSLTVIVKTLTSWEATFTQISGSDGKKAIYVSGADLATPGNTGTKGSKDPTATTAITFTQDTTAPSVAFTPAADTSVTDTTPFVKAKYTDESKVSVTKAEFGESTATTLTDVTASMFSSDEKEWIYAASGLEVKKSYKLTISGKDAAGNELKDQSVTFKVIERAKLSITLVPGSNLVSLPGAPAATGINDVGLPAEVTSVMTYADGAWQVATKADGVLSGTLTTFDSSHAYWVETTGSAPLKVDVPPQSFSAAPPAIAVTNGWNLLPVASVSGAAIGTEISADTYFGSTSWVTAYWYDTANDSWTKVLPKQVPADKVKVGNGYWVYITADGILVP